MLHSFDISHSPDRSAPALEQSDEELMNAVLLRDEHALQTLVTRYRSLLLTIIARVLHNEDETEDVLSEVLFEIWRQAEHYSETRGKVLGWMITIARRRAIDRVRRIRAYGRATDRLQVETEHNCADADYGSAARDTAYADRAEILRTMIEKLPEAQQEAVTLAYFRGMSQRQIAVHTGVALGTIKTRLELALRKIRASLLTVGGEREWVGC
jgi:RNA polymerase sigma-70 factor (ECF subfamily)